MHNFDRLKFIAIFLNNFRGILELAGYKILCLFPTLLT
jgi:hypothetical protein